MAGTITLHFSTPHVLRTARECNAAVAEVDRLLDVTRRRALKNGACW